MATLLSARKAAAFQMGKGDSKNLVGPSTGAQDITLNYSVFPTGGRVSSALSRRVCRYLHSA